MPFIYALADPRTPDKIRYVGMAMQDNRPYEHVNIARKGRNSYCYNWIRLLLDENVEPIISILEQCAENATKKEVGERERYYIGFLRESGHRLTNMTDGGEGGRGLIHSAEARAKISKAKSGIKHTLEARIKCGLKNKGRHHTKEHRIKNRVSQTGKILSAEHRKKISVSRIGMSFSVNHRINLRIARQGRITSKITREKMSVTHTGKAHPVYKKTEAEKISLAEKRLAKRKEKFIAEGGKI